MWRLEPFISKAFIAKAIYGLIAVMAVLQVIDEHPPVPWRGAATLFGTTLGVALVDAYIETITFMFSRQRGPSRTELREVWHAFLPVLVGAQAPTLVLLLAVFGILSIERAISVAQVVALLLLFAYGWRVGQTVHKHPLRQLISGVVLLTIGLLVSGIKAVFH